ncbi:glycerophosphodiester phosphodiesterase [Mangrovimicrobium sediminis]|uniref:glycerophosphodiester phosphodiesterase n=2 Tax=Mangrovimicrobium sediminis TaxID=2562682 RepID=A0A4Z0M9A0_9GAMM|nr:glycerophosphodiester phosphodiesterase [Haliea sp. SAOS-164]
MSQPIVIAHRGASAYLPEHTLEAKALAHAMGADYLEQDVVLSRDGVPVILHDIHLESTSDVATRFPDRAREDGRYYALDFSLEELRELRLHERSRRDDDGLQRAVYPGRFPLGQGEFRLPTLREEIELIDGLNHSRGQRRGLYIELKSPNWHTAQGYEIAVAVLDVLRATGYDQRSEQVFLQCFDDATLIRLRRELHTPLPLIQLIGENDWGEDSAVDYDWLRSEAGLAHIAGYADGIGPWIPQVVALRDNQLAPTGLAAAARARGLLVHPYTLRADDLPDGVDSVDELHRALFEAAGVDGLFSDFPDLTRRFIDELAPRK